MPDLKEIVSRFGAEAKAKLANPSATGEPEDQLRAPLETLFADLAELCGFKREWITAVGESSLSTLKTRPDYAITLRNVLVGFVEVKAPGKGADPRRYRGHDKEQWEKLRSLPNLLYTDGNSFSLWQEGELVASIIDLHGDVETSGAKLAAPLELLARFDNFLRWEPIAPKSAAELAKVAARLCRLLRDEVAEQLAEKSPSLTAEWMPPADWGVGAHAKHLRNLYVYFWRWATWKVFDRDPRNDAGIVCFITVAGFLNGPGFQKMRDYLRRTADRIWVIDCSPEGHQPDVPTRIFQAVQQPVCIVLAARSKRKAGNKPAVVKYTVLPAGKREQKFAALAKLKLESRIWQDCSTDWRASFLPEAKGAWATFPMLDDLFVYNGSGVQPMRVWVIAPDADSLKKRWQALIKAKPENKMDLFHPTLRGGKPSDRHIGSVVQYGLAGHQPRPVPIAEETRPCLPPVRYGHRSFDRQWIIPDPRVITQPNATLWESYSENQVYLTALMDRSPSGGPAVTFTALPPDKHHYSNRSGRIFPLWRDAAATAPNMSPKLLEFLTRSYGFPVTPENFLAYVAGVAANPAYTARFQKDLAQPGLRVPLTAKPELFKKAVKLGRRVIWLHTFGERFADAKTDRPPGPPRLPNGQAPVIPKEGQIPGDAASMPDEMEYDEARRRLLVGKGFVENVPAAVWNYEVSGKRVLTQWFSYRKKNRERPIIGDRRPPSKLGDIQPDHWLADYTTELLNVLHVLALLVEREPAQAQNLEAICAGRTLDFQL